jgi:hypothetical protein
MLLLNSSLRNFRFTNHSNHCRGDTLASIIYSSFQIIVDLCLIFDVKKTSILAKVKFNHL